MFRQPPPVSRTVAFETGCQNVPLASAVIALGFSKEVVPKVIIFPTMYGILQLVNGAIPVSIYRIYRCFRPLEVEESSEEVLEKNVEEGDNHMTKTGIPNDSFVQGKTYDDDVHQNGTLKSSEVQNGGPHIATANSKGGPPNLEFATSL